MRSGAGRGGAARSRRACFSGECNGSCRTVPRKQIRGSFQEDSVVHSRSRGNTADAAPLAPTPQRYRHGLIERLDHPISDTAGTISRPHYAVDTLLAMERRGSITPGMRQAGQDFRRCFAVAQLDPLRASDWSQPRQLDAARRHAADDPGWRIEKAREFVWHTIRAVGGLTSPGGSCLWHVVGWGHSLKDWALEQGWSGRRVSQESASGILIAVLGALDAHYRDVAPLRISNLTLDKSGSI
jgi:hypothetical protein